MKGYTVTGNLDSTLFSSITSWIKKKTPQTKLFWCKTNSLKFCLLFYVISSKFESTTLGFSRKKSPWKHDIQPKCVSLNTRSIIQIMWPAVGPFEYIDCITTPMSAVDWWLQRRRTSSLEMSFKESPDSFTGKNNLSVTRDYSQITLLIPSLFRIYSICW